VLMVQFAKSEGEAKLPQRGIDHHGGDVMQNSTVELLTFFCRTFLINSCLEFVPS
jgi:hypothetical protein